MASPPLYQQRSCPYRLEKAQAKRGQRLTRAEHAVYAPEAPTGDLQPAIHIATRYKHGWVTSIPKSAVCAPCLNLPEGEKRPGSFSLIPRQLQGLVRRRTSRGRAQFRYEQVLLGVLQISKSRFQHRDQHSIL